MATLATKTAIPATADNADRVRTSFAFRTMLIFSFLYYFRPADIIPGLHSIPLAKIFGGLAVLALVLGTGKDRPRKLPIELKLMLVFFAWLAITIPFAFWRVGSFNVVAFGVSKALIVTLTLTFTVAYWTQLRRLIFVQAAGVGLMTVGAVFVNNRMNGRLAGIGEGLLSNPNDLAINIAINLPLCLAFFLRSRGIFKKLTWGFALVFMVYAVMATYSRSGLLALIVACFLSLWEFGIRGKRLYMVALAFFAVMFFLVASPKDYGKRLETLIGIRQRGDKDKGSAEAREDLLFESIGVTATHPIFGVGPGNFPAYTKTWRVTHNTYTELSSECGIPALILFLILLRLSFRNATRVRKSKLPIDPDERLFGAALWAGLGAYLVGAFFASTTYELFPYYMITYCFLLYRIALGRSGAEKSSAKARPAITAATKPASAVRRLEPTFNRMEYGIWRQPK